MYCRLTIIGRDDVDVTERYPIQHMEPGSEVRKGFEEGSLKKATFEMSYGPTLIYEALE